MFKKHMNRKHHLIYVNIKIYYIYMLLSFKFNYILYQIEKNIFLDYKIYLDVRTNLII